MRVCRQEGRVRNNLHYWIILLLASGGLLIGPTQVLGVCSAQAASKEIDEASELHKTAERLCEERDYQKALPLAQRALEIRDRLLPRDHGDIALSARILGLIYLETKVFDRAEVTLKRALDIRERLHGVDNIEIVEDLLNLSDFYRATNDSRRLEQTLARALSIREKAKGPDDAEVAISLNDLGMFYRRQNKYLLAAPLLRRALEIRNKVLKPDDPLRAQSMNSLAANYRDSGDYANAEPLFKQALELREKSPGREGQDLATSLNDLAGLYQVKGDYEQAEPLFLRALEIREKARKESAPVAQSLNNLGLLYKQRGDFERSASFYERALAMRERVLPAGHADIGQALNNLGVLYLDTGDYVRAEPLLERALEIREKSLGPNNPQTGSSVSNLGTLAFFKGDYSKSEKLHLRALDVFERSLGPQHPSSCLSRNNVAQIYNTNRKPALAKALLSRNGEYRERNLSPILSVGSERDKLSYISTLSEETDFTISFNARTLPRDAGAARVALTRVFRLKGRVVDAMADSVGALLRRGNQDDRSLIEQLSAARSRLAALVLRGPGVATRSEHEAAIRELEVEVRRIETAISARSAAFREQSRTVTFEEVQRAIPARSALVEFATYRPFNPTPRSKSDLWGPAHYSAWVVHRVGEPRLVDLGEARPIDAAIGELRSALRREEGKRLSDIERTVKPLARALDEKVMRPIRKLVGSKRSVLLSPDGALNLVPFAVLVDERNQYLVKQYSFTYLTSGRDLLRLQTGAHGKTGKMIIADPDFGERPPTSAADDNARDDLYFSPLKATEQEAKDLKRLFPDAVVMTRSEATESALKAADRPALLHIATHGFFLSDEQRSDSQKRDGDNTRLVVRRREKSLRNEENTLQLMNPLIRSGLGLSGANRRQGGDGNDGILTALEAAGLDLWGTKLVVLSACDTGIGKVVSGDGVYGLRRALVLAGSESQMISLWPVSDAGTRELMIEYYRGLKRGEERSEALRRVQLKMLASKNRNHPFYWASFIQSGEWANLRGTRLDQ